MQSYVTMFQPYSSLDELGNWWGRMGSREVTCLPTHMEVYVADLYLYDEPYEMYV